MSNTEEHLFRRELDKQDLAIAELKAIIKERESELKTLTKEHYELQLKHNTVATTHQQELNGVEQSKKNFLGDLMAVIKDKEAMDGIAGVIQSVKSGENNKALSQTESEELQAVKHFFNTLSGDDQLLLGENIFVYTKRPDLLQKHNQDLKNIVNS